MSFIDVVGVGGAIKPTATDTAARYDIPNGTEFSRIFIGNLSTDTAVHFRLGDNMVTATAFDASSPPAGDVVIPPGGKIRLSLFNGTSTKATHVSLVTASGSAEVAIYCFDVRVMR